MQVDRAARGCDDSSTIPESRIHVEPGRHGRLRRTSQRALLGARWLKAAAAQGHTEALEALEQLSQDPAWAEVERELAAGSGGGAEALNKDEV